MAAKQSSRAGHDAVRHGVPVIRSIDANKQKVIRGQQYFSSKSA